MNVYEVVEMQKAEVLFVHAKKTHRGSGGVLYSLLSSALDGGEWSASRADRFNSRESALFTHCARGRAGVPAVCLDILEKGFEPWIVQPLS
jgi:hypothetical protein